MHQISVYQKTERSDTIILGILVHFSHFRHFISSIYHRINQSIFGPYVDVVTFFSEIIFFILFNLKF